MINNDKINHYSCLKLCNKIRSCLIQTACNYLQTKNKVVLLEINIPIDVINLMSFKTEMISYSHYVFSYKENLFDFIHDKQKTYKLLPKNINDTIKSFCDEPLVFCLMFSLNSPKFTLEHFKDILESKQANNFIILGMYYDLDIFKTNNIANSNIVQYVGNELSFTYNLYSGLQINNTVNFISENDIKDLCNLYEFKVDFKRFDEYECFNNDKCTNIELKKSLLFRKTFIIR